ncbi:hypothetical protein MPSEU_000165600 [Mayamaea pseudoterrestris]|nr:hypothetical protein MPSEU_000165600 [Mayamaea pseudoterrestris]
MMRYPTGVTKRTHAHPSFRNFAITMNIGRLIFSQRRLATSCNKLFGLTTLNSMKSRSFQTKAHYEAHSTDSYENAYFYEPGAYTNYLTKLVQDRLGLHQEPLRRTLLDVGGGTGNFTKMIIQDTQTRAIVVDPFLAAADEKAKSSEGTSKQLEFVCAPAETFMQKANENDYWWRRNYHQVLLKEVIHHIDSADHRIEIFRGLYQGLHPLADSSSNENNLPSLLVITRPQVDIDYPLWPEAKHVWAKNQPSSELLTQELVTAGFAKVEQSVHGYPCSIPLDRWLGMIKQRFWSTFSNFSDQELQEACKLIAESEVERLDDNGCIHFEDRLVFIAAYK